MKKPHKIIISLFLLIIVAMAISKIDSLKIKGDIINASTEEAYEIIHLNTAYIGEEYTASYFLEFQNFYELAEPMLPVHKIDTSTNVHNRLSEGLYILHNRTNPLLGIAREEGIFYFTLKVLDSDRMAITDNQGRQIFKHFVISVHNADADFNSDGTIDETDLSIYDEIMRGDTFQQNNPDFQLSILQRQQLQSLYQQFGKIAPQGLY